MLKHLILKNKHNITLIKKDVNDPINSHPRPFY